MGAIAQEPLPDAVATAILAQQRTLLKLQRLQDRLQECMGFARPTGGDAKELCRLLDAGFPTDDLAGGWSLAHCACAGGQAEILEILIERGAPLDIDAATAYDLYERGPPLNVALSRGRDILAGRLLDAGADAVAARAAESPLHVACDCGNVAMAARLLAAGARADAEDEDGETPLERATYACRLRYAMSEEELAMLERLLEGAEDATVVEG